MLFTGMGKSRDEANWGGKIKSSEFEMPMGHPSGEDG